MSDELARDSNAPILTIQRPLQGDYECKLHGNTASVKFDGWGDGEQWTEGPVCMRCWAEVCCRLAREREEGQ